MKRIICLAIAALALTVPAAAYAGPVHGFHDDDPGGGWCWKAMDGTWYCNGA